MFDHIIPPTMVRVPAIALILAIVGITQSTLAAVGDRDPYQGLRSASCAASTQCSADFKPVPANSRVEITSESCLFTSSNGPSGLPLVASVEFAVLDAT